MPKPWRLIHRETVVDSPWFRLHRERQEMGNGHILDPYWAVEAPSWVCVVALTPDHRVVLVEQYRRGIDRIARELPAGNLEPGEDPAACAVRELAEETGFAALAPAATLGALVPEPARSNAVAHGFLVRVAAAPGPSRQESSEDIATVLVPLADLADPLAVGMVHGVHHAFIARALGRLRA